MLHNTGNPNLAVVVAGGSEPIGPPRDLVTVSPGAAEYVSRLRHDLAACSLTTTTSNGAVGEGDDRGSTEAAAGALLAASAEAGGPSTSSLLCLGPLTNIAAAERLSPGWLSSLGSVVIMGGALRVRGDAPSGAEWNFFLDSVAASEVMAALPAGRALVVGNEVACKAAVCEETLAWLLDGASPATNPNAVRESGGDDNSGDTAASGLEEEERQGGGDDGNHASQLEQANALSRAGHELLRLDKGALRYDPLASACMLDRSLVRTSETVRLCVDPVSGVLREDPTQQAPLVQLATGIDHAAYREMLGGLLRIRGGGGEEHAAAATAGAAKTRKAATAAAESAATSTAAATSAAAPTGDRIVVELIKYAGAWASRQVGSGDEGEVLFVRKSSMRDKGQWGLLRPGGRVSLTIKRAAGRGIVADAVPE